MVGHVERRKSEMKRAVISAVSKAGGLLDSRSEEGKALIFNEVSKYKHISLLPRGLILRDAARSKFAMVEEGIFYPREIFGKGLWVLTFVAASSSARPPVGTAGRRVTKEIQRMVATALHTVANSNGQLVLRRVKAKDTDMTKGELLAEVAMLYVEQNGRCKLTNFDFRSDNSNEYLMPSLDRIDSSRGYVRGNLQIVTRGANLYKSNGDNVDWEKRVAAMVKMVLSLRGKR